MKCLYHGWVIVPDLPPFGDNRCWYCGHRVPNNGVPPRETRTFHIKYWFPELRSRRQARFSPVTEVLTPVEHDRMMFGIEPQEAYKSTHYLEG